MPGDFTRQRETLYAARGELLRKIDQKLMKKIQKLIINWQTKSRAHVHINHKISIEIVLFFFLHAFVVDTCTDWPF